MFLIVSEKGNELSPIMPKESNDIRVFEILGYNSIMMYSFSKHEWMPVMMRDEFCGH
jgi:hypothetical protein